MRVMATNVARTMGMRHDKALAKWPCNVQNKKTTGIMNLRFIPCQQALWGQKGCETEKQNRLVIAVTATTPSWTR